MRSQRVRVAIVGATGAVGTELLRLLNQRSFPAAELSLFASQRSEGRKVHSNGWGELVVEVLRPGCFDACDLVFFDASDEVSRKWVPEALEAHAWVVDNSGAFRMDDRVGLVVPEVNGEELARRIRSGVVPPGLGRLVAGPNCSTVQLVLPLQILHQRWGLKRIVVSSYQSVSGAGQRAMDELRDQVVRGAEWKKSESAFPHPIGWNCIPQIGSFDASGESSEERKIQSETRKILGLPDLPITATAVRVPTLHCHAESVNVELARPYEIDELRSTLARSPGIQVIDHPAESVYPTGLQSHKNDAVAVGRIRRDGSVANGLNLWVVSDNLMKGAALNAIQIAELVLDALE